MLDIAPPPTGSTGTTQEVELDGEYYRLTQRWNDRAVAWVVDLATIENTPLAAGMPMRAGSAMTLHLRHREGMPPGALVTYDTSGRETDPDFTDLNNRVRLVYLTADEVAELGL